MNTHNAEKRVCVNMQSHVNIRCHLKTVQAVSTNFGDSPRTYCLQKNLFLKMSASPWETDGME